MSENRKLAAILAADVVGFSRLAGADEDRTLARLRALRSDLIDPTIAVHNGRVVKRTGDGALVEFRSVVDAVRCAVEIQDAIGRAQLRRAGGSADQVPHRNSFGRPGRGERRRPDGRRRQYRGPTRRRRAAGRNLSVGRRLSTSQSAPRPSGQRSRREAAQNIAEPVHVYSLQLGHPAQATSAAPAEPRP